ncbi:DHA2 family multidrug resistance protein-like MFS transporter [Actinoalloteichus hoggarensis]|uniref:Antiseptic resistance protein n=1 Tax=Actinoalloteichus hoggarensis TaxID=1470176 RepID=A0A221W3U6_9PSEU|nr:MFS transporter [Actinoalloteichus hoggarensis]ASO20311.1 Antiseptic resistance protein [Actinoalloteichus hoggarensis]MBB5918975.1 DHA2 family multidrug resistance protein-like MFS transporter [Actinoalloteichus hoggarensis]
MTHAPPSAGTREWLGLAVLALPTLLIAMDMTVLHLAVPALTADLAPSGAQLLWIIDVYGFLVAGLLVTMGALGDRIGRRRLLLVGATAFALASVLAAFSTSAEMLIVTRALLGVAGATLMPSTLSLIRVMFEDAAQRRAAIGVWMTCFMVGTAIGPLAGGVLLNSFWWGSVFLLGVPVMVLLLAVGPFLLPEQRDRGAGRLDLISASLSLVAILLVVGGLKALAEDGLGWPQLAASTAGVALAIVFVRRQRGLADPLLDPRLFRVPAFSVSVTAQFLAIFAMSGVQLLGAQYLQLVLGLSPLQAGLWTVPSVLASTAGTLLVPVITRHARPAPVMATGLALAGIGGLVLASIDTAGLSIYVLGFMLIGLGLGPTMTLATDQIIGAAPARRVGAASAISETGGELGGALGIAVLGSLGGVVYRSAIADGLPAGLPASAADPARETLGGAVASAGLLSGDEAAAMLEAARTAFVDGLRVVATTSSVIIIGVAVLVGALLRRSTASAAPALEPKASEAVEREPDPA